VRCLLVELPPPQDSTGATALDGGGTVRYGIRVQMPQPEAEGELTVELLRQGTPRYAGSASVRLVRGSRNTAEVLMLPVNGAGGTCDPCGASGQACCGNNVCNSGLRCGAAPAGGGTRMCEPCGASGQICCNAVGGATACTTGLSCVGAGNGNPGTCGVCGAAGQACCANNMCAVGFACVRGAGADGGLGALSCMACGASGQRCCNGACNAGLTCTGQGGGNAGTCG